MGQLSFFSADAHPRALTDLAGVLCARGQLSVFGRGTTARLSIVLGSPPAPPVDNEPGNGPDVDGPADDEARDEDPDDDPDDDPAADPDDDPDESAHREPDPVAEWRAHALCCAFRTRGVDAEVDRLDDGRPVVRSAYRADLVALARAWTRGAVKAAPPDLDLDGPLLRLWVLAAGRRHGPAYLLGLDPHAPGTHDPLLTASRRSGLGATIGGDRAEPVLRIVGRRRQARLAELVGEAPRSLIDGIWPG